MISMETYLIETIRAVGLPIKLRQRIKDSEFHSISKVAKANGVRACYVLVFYSNTKEFVLITDLKQPITELSVTKYITQTMDRVQQHFVLFPNSF